jgi:co-chaperonin GroES (HSP10)
MKPLNRRLLIEVLNPEEESSGAFFVPQEEKQRPEFSFGRVIACADDCSRDLAGSKVVFTTFGLESVTIASTEYSFIGENHLVCWE